MGEEVTKISIRTTSENERKDGNGGSSESTRTTNTNTTNERNGSGRTDNNGSGKDGNEEREKIVSKMVDVSEEEKRAERNRKRREQYAQKKAENGETVKPRKVNTRKKKTDNDNSEQIKMLLMTVSGVIASKENCSHWQLTPNEVDSIAKPLSNILANSKAFESMGEHADAVALVMACVTVLLPRVIITVSQTKRKKEVKNNVNGNSRKVDGTKGLDEKSKNNNSNNGDNRKVTDNGANDVKNEFIFGSPLS